MQAKRRFRRGRMDQILPSWLRAKLRRHHNNKGRAAIKSGAVARQVAAMAARLGVRYAG